MTQTADIGAARIYLDVDVTNWDATLKQAHNAAVGFGADAERAFDKSSDGVRRAATRMLDYVNALGRADTQMERYVRNAARAGVDEPIIRAAIARWEEYQRQVEATTDAMREAAEINKAFDQQRAANAQREFNEILGVESTPATQMGASMDALIAQARQFDAELEQAWTTALQIDAAFNQQRATLAQVEVNRLLGIDQGSARQAGATIDALTQQFREMDMVIDEAFAHDQQIERLRQQIQRMSETTNDFYQNLQMQADRLGVGEAFRPMIAGLRESNEAMGRGTLSAKQYEWAMRGLPAQITDIAVSLASGQPAYMVMLQQGGQLKDMFGGVGAAARALGGAVLNMINPLTVGAALLAGFAFSANAAQRDLYELDSALIMTGGYAAQSSTHLRGLVNSIADLEGVTAGGARAAVVELAKTAQFTGQQFDMIAESAARMAAASGLAVDEVIDKFTSIADDPVKALLELNDAEHFLTAAQLERVEALVEEGREQEAVAEALRIYAQQTDRVASALQAAQPHLAQFTSQMKELASEAWEGTKNITEFLLATSKVTAQRSAAGRFGFMGAINFMRDMYSAESAPPAVIPTTPGAVDSDKERERIKKREEAQREADRERERQRQQWDRFNTQSMDKAQRLQEELNEAERIGISLGHDRATIERVLEGIRTNAAEKGRNGRGSDGTQAIRDQAAAELAALQTQARMAQSHYEQRELSVTEYYDKLMSLAQQERDVQLRANQDQIAALAGRGDAEQKIAQLRSNSARVNEQFAQREIELNEQRRKSQEELRLANLNFLRSLQDGQRDLRREMDDMASAVGMGGREAEIAARITDEYRRQSDQIAELRRQMEDKTIEGADGERRIQQVMDDTIERLQTIRDGYERRAAAEGDWLNGVRKAWEDLRTEANDFAGLFEGLTSDLYGGLADAVVDFTHTMSLSLDDLGGKIGDTITRFLTMRALMSGLEHLGGQGGAWGAIANVLMGKATPNAKGNVYSDSGLSAYRNQIVHQPIIFPFAKGGVPNMGVAGEAGSEGIFPLRRDSKGNLGVSALMDNTKAKNVTVNVYGAPSEPQVQVSEGPDGDVIEVMFGQFESRVGQRIAQGQGPVYSGIKNRFPVKDR